MELEGRTKVNIRHALYRASDKHLRLLLAWLAKNPATFGQHFPEIRWDSARSQGTVLLSVVWWSYLT